MEFGDVKPGALFETKYGIFLKVLEFSKAVNMSIFVIAYFAQREEVDVIANNLSDVINGEKPEIDYV